jgi:hypothetical protein
MAVIDFDDLVKISEKWGAYAVPFDGRVKSERRFYVKGVVVIYRGGTFYASDGQTPIDKWFETVVGMMTDLYRLTHELDDGLHTLEDDRIAIVS